MKWPFVTRARFERTFRRMKKYKRELGHLQEVVGQMKAEEVAKAEDNLDARKGPIQPIGGRLTLEMIIAKANKDARDRAKAGGSVVQDLREAAFKGKRDAIG